MLLVKSCYALIVLSQNAAIVMIKITNKGDKKRIASTGFISLILFTTIIKLPNEVNRNKVNGAIKAYLIFEKKVPIEIPDIIELVSIRNS